MKERVEAFNRKWRGKEVYFCELIGTTLNFNPEEFNFCCSSTTGRFPVAYNITDMNY